MCRTGGRRCPCSRGQLNRHNERRRRNRAIKKAVLDHLRQLPTEQRDQDLINRLDAAPPIEAKRWALANSLSLPGGDATDPGLAPAAHPAAPPARDVPRGAAAGVPRGAAAGVPRAAAADVRQPPADVVEQMLALLRQIGVPVPSERPPTPRQSESIQPHVDAAMAGQGQIPVERLLLDSQPISSRRVGRGVNDARRVDLGNGVHAYHKTFNSSSRVARGFGQHEDLQPVFEVAAWRLAERLGPPWSQLVAPCVLREIDGHLGSLSLERPGEVGTRVDHHPEAGKAAGFFDRLIGQQDRHGGNFLVDQRGITLIDHGFSFSRPGDITNARYLQDYRTTSEPLLRGNERDALTRLLSSPDSLGMRGLLPADRLEAMLARAREMLSRGTIA